MYASVWCYNLKVSILIHLFKISPRGEAVIYEYGNAGVHKTHASGRHGEYVLYDYALRLWVLSMELASCHASGALNFAMAPNFFLICALVVNAKCSGSRKDG
jgi:hypothetical protein